MSAIGELIYWCRQNSGFTLRITETIDQADAELKQFQVNQKELMWWRKHYQSEVDVATTPDKKAVKKAANYLEMSVAVDSAREIMTRMVQEYKDNNVIYTISAEAWLSWNRKDGEK